MILRDYQRRAVDNVIAALDRRPILVAPTGSGKTVMATAMVEQLRVSTLWLAHRKELIDQAAKRLEAHGLVCGIIMAGYAPMPLAQVQVASVQTLIRRDKPPADLIVIDECFPAGTLVDGCPIETIRVGDTVTAWDHARACVVRHRVTRTFRRPAPAQLIRITAQRYSVVCTPTHPVMANDVWTEARDLKLGDLLYGLPRLRSSRASEGEAMSSVLPPGDGREEPYYRATTDATAQSHTTARGQGAHLGSNEGTRPQDTGRERSQDTAACGEARSGTGTADGVHRPHREQGTGPAHALQDRHCQSRIVARDRSGRSVALPAEPPATGPKEGSVLEFARVDRVETVQRGRDEAYGNLCPDGYVYNLEVEGVSTYTANGLIVHNCHHATADSYQSILDAYPQARVVGLTATPFRLDGQGLGDLFGELVVAAYPHELCESGVLHRPKVWASKSPDLRGIKVIAGDYSIGALAERTNTHELNADIVATWLKRAPGKRTVAFAVDVAHSRAITEAFREAGIPAEHVDGSTPRDERDAILARLASGETLIVSNCMVLTEGWDLPALECAIIARPTASLNLHLQMIGRVMRAADGKDGAIVLDHAGNHHVHGLVTRGLNYSLNGEKVGHSEPLGLRRCGECGLLYELHLESCPECGWAPTAEDRRRERPEVHAAGELTEFDDSSFEYRRQIWNLIEAEREAMGYREGWSYYRFEERFGTKPVVADGELIDPANATLEQKRAVFEHLTQIAEQRGYKPGWASYRFRDMFGCWPRGFVTDVRRACLRTRFMEAGA